MATSSWVFALQTVGDYQDSTLKQNVLALVTALWEFSQQQPTVIEKIGIAASEMHRVSHNWASPNIPVMRSGLRHVVPTKFELELLVQTAKTAPKPAHPSLISMVPVHTCRIVFADDRTTITYPQLWEIDTPVPDDIVYGALSPAACTGLVRKLMAKLKCNVYRDGGVAAFAAMKLV